MYAYLYRGMLSSKVYQIYKINVSLSAMSFILSLFYYLLATIESKKHGDVNITQYGWKIGRLLLASHSKSSAVNNKYFYTIHQQLHLCRDAS